MKTRVISKIAAGVLSAVIALASASSIAFANMPPLTAEPNPATDNTRAINHAVLDLLDFDDRQEFEFATRGFITAPESLQIFDGEGGLVWSQKAFEFIRGDAPYTANPSLWRHSQLNHIYGLFEVTEGIYQVRGYDISNLTVIAGETGWIIFDIMTNVETARAAMQLVNDTLGERPIMAVIYSHTHADHFGGVRAVITEEEILARNIPIIAPEHFERYAVSENIYAGTAMSRRADFQFGRRLPAGERGRLGLGLGIAMPGGTGSYIPPNDWITYTGEVRVIDGVTMVFQMTPGTEAPAEMNTWFPDKNALWLAENGVATMHNLYTLRGAQIRDGNAWAGYLMETLSLFGAEAEVLFQSHNWPRWGNDVITEYLINTAAIYKFIHDQTLMYINQGFTSSEIAHKIQLPAALERVWYTRGYYGTLQHNARAVYQKYMGWYDGNPVNLHPLPPSEFAERLVEYLGCVDKVLELARRDFERGYYQWVAQITNILVFADPANIEARLLCADALEQLGYQAESGVWRAAYLTGAMELREGSPSPAPRGGGSDMRRSMQPFMILDYLGIRLNSTAAQDLNFRMNLNVTGDTSYLVTVRAGAFLYQANMSCDDADVTITLSAQAVFLLLSPYVLESEYVQAEGDTGLFLRIYDYMAEFDPFFNIIEPHAVNEARTEETWELVREAYIFAFPLVFLESNFNSIIGTKDPNTGETITVNMLQYSPTGRIGADSQATTQPNTDVMYAHALLDLSQDAVVLHKPASDVFWSAQVIDAYINTVAILGSGEDRPNATQDEARFLITGPNFDGNVPDYMIHVPAPTNMVWLPIRVKLTDDWESKRDELGLMTLSAYLEHPEKLVGNAVTYNRYEILFNPLRNVLEMEPQEFFDRANRLMLTNSPADADRPALERFAAIGVGPGLAFDAESLGDALENWIDMVRNLPYTLREEIGEFLLLNGQWTLYGEPTKNFGTEYAYRAYIVYQGAAINPSFVAVYLTTYTDNDGDALIGKNNYIIRFEPSGLPLVREFGFWSITAYGANNYLIPNDESRYSVENRPDLVFNADGSLHIYLQAEAPADPSLRNNWIPVNTDGEYNLMFRIYLADDTVFDGTWAAPDIIRQ